MIKFTHYYQLKLLGDEIIYHGIRLGDPKFKPCLHSTSHLKNKIKFHVLGLKGSLGSHLREIIRIMGTTIKFTPSYQLKILREEVYYHHTLLFK